MHSPVWAGGFGVGQNHKILHAFKETSGQPNISNISITSQISARVDFHSGNLSFHFIKFMSSAYLQEILPEIHVKVCSGNKICNL